MKSFLEYLLEDGVGGVAGGVSVASTGATLGDGKVNTTGSVGNLKDPLPNEDDIKKYKEGNKTGKGGVARRKNPIKFGTPATTEVQPLSGFGGPHNIGTITQRENPMGPVPN